MPKYPNIVITQGMNRMGVTPSQPYANGLVLKANTSDNISNSNPDGLNDILLQALSLTQPTSQTVAGPLVLSGAVTHNGPVTNNGATTLAGTNTISGSTTFSNTATFSTVLVNNGAEQGNVVFVSALGPYAVQATDRYIMATFVGALTINLPATPAQGRRLTIKDANGDGSINNIVVSAGTSTIDGSATLTLNQNYASVDLLFTNVWMIL